MKVKAFFQALLVVALLCGAWLAFLFRTIQSDGEAANPDSRGGVQEPVVVDRRDGGDAGTRPQEPVEPGELAQAEAAQDPAANDELRQGPIGEAYSNLSSLLDSSSDRLALLRELEELRNALNAMPSTEASQWIRRFLGSGVDLSLPFAFAVGENGWLDSAPSLRSWLLDEWAALDPRAAADYARRAFSQPLSEPAEHALHMRNYVLAEGRGPEVRSVLETQIRRVLAMESWFAEPSSALAESFDVLVFAEAYWAVPSLMAWATSENRSHLRQAARLSLDRLFIMDPLSGLEQMMQAGTRGPDSGFRASLVARADLSDPQQYALVQSYLMAPETSSAERESFYQRLPNLDLALSHNLVSQTYIWEHDDGVHRARAALEALEEWSGDARFASDQDLIMDAIVRLERILPEE